MVAELEEATSADGCKVRVHKFGYSEGKTKNYSINSFEEFVFKFFASSKPPVFYVSIIVEPNESDGTPGSARSVVAEGLLNPIPIVVPSTFKPPRKGGKSAPKSASGRSTGEEESDPVDSLYNRLRAQAVRMLSC